MAEKRMFSKKITSSDAFLDMFALSQALYFHLALMADDDGFIDSTRSVMRSVGASKENIDQLIDSNFLIYFEDDGVSVIRHWKINNNIRGDTYKETKYKNLKNQLAISDGVYSLQNRNRPLQERNEPVTEPLQQAKTDIVSRIEQHRRYWESCGLPPAPVIINQDELSRIKPVMDSFTAEKIDGAIKNFSAVVSQPDFNPDILPGGHIPNFKNFLIHWVDRFTNEARPLEVYGQKTKAKPPPGKGPDWGGAVDMGKGVKSKNFFGGSKK
jgi:hypothetical protein